MDIEQSIAIAAPRERVWDILVDVERWPEWTPSMTSVTFAGGNRLAKGSRLRIKQPRMPAMTWDVTEIEPLQSFTWNARSLGVTTSAVHRLAPGPKGGVTVGLVLQQRGVLAWLVALFTAGIMRRYVRMEAEGLKQRCESPAQAHADAP